MSKLRDDLISNISYTNKDFDSIYNELLDLVKKLTDRWDPSQSNESDPGVLLLKLVAIMGDKNNYNIDKNVLECFPLSVTQEGNARNLYDSLGYIMKWYQSALAAPDEITFKCIDNSILKSENGEMKYIDIPAFTSITNNTSDIEYVTLNDITIKDYNVPSTCACIQGTWKQYEINGDKLITLNNLDAERKLYFTERQIAENGIFVINNQHTDKINYYSENNWKKVDNLVSYPSSQKIYQFGVTADTNTCYIQFPEDISSLIGEGLLIRYIISDGETGNIKANTLTSFSNNLTLSSTASSSESDTDTTVVNEYLKISQPNAIVNGKDPESLTQAYINYKKTVGTFNTLITRRDYENFINRLNETANCIVSDRTCDINFTNYIQTWGPLYNIKKLLIAENNGNPTMTAFQLYFYLCQYVENVNTLSSYIKTFTPDNDAYSLLQIESELQDIKAVQHDINVPQDVNLIFNYNNYYDIQATLILQTDVTLIEKKSIEDTVKLALYKNFNSKNLQYGVELNSEDVINIILQSDNRIKNVVLTNFSYNPYMRNFANNVISLDSDLQENVSSPCQYDEMIARMILAGNVQLYKYNDNFNWEFGQQDSAFINNIKTITTQVLIDLYDSTNPYTLKNNESLQLWADNYVTSAEYGAYCKFICNGNTVETIPSNMLYCLKNAWNVRYTDGIKTIPAGTIVYSNTEISNNTKLSSNGSLQIKIPNSKKIVSSTEYICILNNNNDLWLDPDTYYILEENEYFIYPDSTRTSLVIYGMGTRLANGGNNRIDLKPIESTISDVSDDNINNIAWNVLKYDLQAYETSIIVLNKNTSVWLLNGSLKKIDNDYKDLTFDSTQELIGSTWELNDTLKFGAIGDDITNNFTPQENVSKAYKCEIEFRDNNNDTYNALQLILYNDNNIKLQYVDQDSTITIYDTNNNLGPWLQISGQVITIISGSDNYTDLKSWLSLNSDSNKVIVKYKLASETEEHSIESNNIQLYHIRSRLNINSTTNEPQQLLQNQTFEVKGDSTETLESQRYIQFSSDVIMAGGKDLDMGVLETNTSTGESEINYSLQGYAYTLGESYTRINNELQLGGNKWYLNNNIDFTSLPEYAERYSITFECEGALYTSLQLSKIYGFIQYDSTNMVYSNGQWVDDIYRTIKIIDPNQLDDTSKTNLLNFFNSNSMKFIFSVPSNITYLVPVKLTKPEDSDDAIDISGASLYNPTDVNNASDIDIHNLQTGSYILKLDTGSPTTLEFNHRELTADSSIEVGKISYQVGLNSDEINYTYSQQNVSQDYKISERIDYVLKKIKEIDIGNVFDWTYRVKEEDKVLQPTAPKSFWNENHIANKYTLPYIDFNTSVISVSANNIV